MPPSSPPPLRFLVVAHTQHYTREYAVTYLRSPDESIIKTRRSRINQLLRCDRATLRGTPEVKVLSKNPTVPSMELQFASIRDKRPAFQRYVRYITLEVLLIYNKSIDELPKAPHLVWPVILSKYDGLMAELRLSRKM